MRILFVCPYLPYPVLSGGHTRVFNIIKQLSTKHQLSFLGYNREPVTNEQRQVLQKYCPRLKFIQRDPIWSPSNLFRYITSLDPLMHVINGRNSRVTMAVEEETEEFRPDLIHVEHYHMADCVLKANRSQALPKVLSEQGVEYLILERMAQVRRNPIKKLAVAAEAARIKPFEIGICNRFDACIEVSQDDKMIIERAGVRVPVKVAINGVDTEYFSPIADKSTEPAIVFVGTFKFFGNVDAVRWLLDQVWPHIRQQHPQVKFYIVGNQPPAWLQNVKDPNITVTGWVPDVREYLNKSQVVVAPLRMGSGTKLKILEAMSMARPVVTTAVGAEGIGAQDGVHLLIRDDPKEFARAVNELLLDRAKASAMGLPAQQFIDQRYSWEKSADQLSEIYHSVIAGKKGTAS